MLVMMRCLYIFVYGLRFPNYFLLCGIMPDMESIAPGGQADWVRGAGCCPDCFLQMRRPAYSDAVLSDQWEAFHYRYSKLTVIGDMHTEAMVVG